MSSEPAPLTPEDVRTVARLSRLEIPEDQVEEYRVRLGAVLGYVERLRELDVEGVEPLAHVGEEAHRLRDDEPAAGLANEVLMRMAPDAMAPFVKIPKVIGDGGGA